MIDLEDIRKARERISSQVNVTPCTPCSWLEGTVGASVSLKLENLHKTGSFKERGALNKLLTLSESQRKRGVIAASAGNHAQAVASHARRLGIDAVIVMPKTTPSIKIANTRGFGARVVLSGNSYDSAFSEAQRIAETEDREFVHAFDDDTIIAGQGTMGLEILEQVSDLSTVVVPIGGGGMISGIAVAIKTLRPEVRIVGVESELVPSMKAAVAAGKPVEVAGGPTLADGIAVKQVAARTLEIVARHVDDIVLVDEEEIASAILFLLEREKTLAEGAGAVAVAALMTGKIGPSAGRPVVAVVGGGNIDVTMLGKIIDRGLAKDGRLVRLMLRVQDRPGGLVEVLAIVAGQGGNIVEVRHERTFTHTLYNDVEILLTLETLGRDHIAEIKSALEKIAQHVAELG